MRPATAIPNEQQAIQIETEEQELFLLERQNQNYRRFTMATSNKLTDKRLKEIAALPVTYDDDIPEFSDSDLKDFVPAHPEYFKVTPIKKTISIKIDIDVLEALKAQGERLPNKNKFYSERGCFP